MNGSSTPTRVLSTLGFATSCLLLLAGCAITGSAATTGADIDTFMQIRWPAAAHLSPDGSLYYVYDPDGIFQLYKVPPDKPQANAVKLTTFEDGVSGYSVSDDGKWMTVTAATGGSEQDDLYLMNAATSQMETLFTDPDVVYGNAVWRRDSRAFAYRANDESPSDFHVYYMDLQDRTPRKLVSGSGFHYAADFNGNGSRLVVGKFLSATHSKLFEVTVATGEIREITPPDEQWAFSPVGYSADDRTFLVTTNYHGDLRSLKAIDLETGAINDFLPELQGLELDGAVMNEDRTILAVLVNEDGYGALHLYDAEDYSPRPLPEMAKGVVGNVTFTGPYMLYSLNNANTPGIVYKWNVNKPDGPPVALTEADLQGIDVSEFLLPKLVHYESFDGEKIPAFLYLPPGYKKGRRIPFVIHYHGGPEAQWRPTFARSFQFLMGKGFGLMAPNVRGSSGYGKSCLEADNYKDRYKSVQDGIYAAKYLIDQGYTEPKSIGAWGSSYGGFMVMAAITEAPELFGAAVNVVGIVNFETFLEQTKSYRRELREVEYGPLTDRAFLRSISPIHKVDKIETPLMLAHGLNDPRVPIGEAMQIAVALKKRGLEVEELYFPDEGHGFAKEENRLLYFRQMVDFFSRHLRKR
jgi:dipeptidyl aminopeptidase/acylaminoacyl peptidase